MAQTGPTAATLENQVDLFLASVGQGFNAYLERRGRMDEMARLSAKSDADLARLGVTRERIPEYVFGDVLG